MYKRQPLEIQNNHYECSDDNAGNFELAAMEKRHIARVFLILLYGIATIFIIIAYIIVAASAVKSSYKLELLKEKGNQRGIYPNRTPSLFQRLHQAECGIH